MQLGQHLGARRRVGPHVAQEQGDIDPGGESVLTSQGQVTIGGRGGDLPVTALIMNPSCEPERDDRRERVLQILDEAEGVLR